MVNTSNFKNKKIAVMGLARTGIAAAEVLMKLEANITIFDNKDEKELGVSVELMRSAGARVITGVDKIDLENFDLLVVSPGVPASHEIFIEAKNKKVDAISEIELAYQISKAPIVAITGTNGKTTTAILLKTMLRASGKNAYVAGNVAAGDIKLPLIQAVYSTDEDSIIVAEISSFQLENIKTFKPIISMVLNMSPDHMDRYANMDEYISAKKRIFENQSKNEYCIINKDNAITKAMDENNNANIVWFSLNEKLDNGGWLDGDILKFTYNGSTYDICNKNDLALRGMHNVENVLAASAASILLGAEIDNISQAAVSFQPVEHRLEPVAVINDVEYINNSMCTNIDAAVNSINALSNNQIIIAGGKDKVSDYTKMAEAFKKKAKFVILIGQDAHLIEKAALKVGYKDYVFADSMEDAVNIAFHKAKPNDVVVLTPGCASFGMFTSFEHRGNAFKEAVNKLSRGNFKDEKNTNKITS
ncbi:MAG: UDP-N-acetylmuramoyl-L-alanine--D-glutamate ligase [Armatimonadota bacterium]